MYHEPVLAKESITLLQIKPNGVYVDATFGGGGHSKLILEQLGDDGQLFGFDQDEDAAANALEDERFIFVQANFKYLARFLKAYGVNRIDGILADLGVSSHQFDEGSRGFSYRFEGDLDMRMNQYEGKTAAEILNTYPTEALQQLFSTYGEVRNAKTLALAIHENRQTAPFTGIQDFLDVLEGVIRGQRLRYLSQVFQALRMEVNDEMGALEDLLRQSFELLEVGGNAVVISYHSIEDRSVKQFFKTGDIEGVVKRDYYGNIFRPFKFINKKAIEPTKEEIARNSRARSAKLRAATKLAVEMEGFDWD